MQHAMRGFESLITQQRHLGGAIEIPGGARGEAREEAGEGSQGRSKRGSIGVKQWRWPGATQWRQQVREAREEARAQDAGEEEACLKLSLIHI